jgi:hypothetical protein
MLRPLVQDEHSIERRHVWCGTRNIVAVGLLARPWERNSEQAVCGKADPQLSPDIDQPQNYLVRSVRYRMNWSRQRYFKSSGLHGKKFAL